MIFDPNAHAAKWSASLSPRLTFAQIASWTPSAKNEHRHIIVLEKNAPETLISEGIRYVRLVTLLIPCVAATRCKHNSGAQQGNKCGPPSKEASVGTIQACFG
jgi:hypothetical protein